VAVNLTIILQGRYYMPDFVFVNGHICTDRNMTARSLLGNKLRRAKSWKQLTSEEFLDFDIIKIQLDSFSQVFTIILHFIIPFFKIPINTYINSYPDQAS
jgi:hypothetical protein